MRIYKFDLQSIHRAELRPLTGAIRILPNRKLLSTYIVYLAQMAVFMILEQGSKRIKTTLSTLNYSTTVGTKELFTSSQLRLWITKASVQRASSYRK